MKDEIAQIQAAINSASYRIDELERAQAQPPDKISGEILAINRKFATIADEIKKEKEAAFNNSILSAERANKLNVLESALHESADSLRNDLIKESNRINDIKKEFKKEIELINGKIADLKNDSENVQTMIADILQELQNEVKKTVTKDFISDLYKKG